MLATSAQRPPRTVTRFAGAFAQRWTGPVRASPTLVTANLSLTCLRFGPTLRTVRATLASSAGAPVTSTSLAP